MKELRAAVIGLGMSGRYIHCDYFASAPGLFKLVAVADPAEDRRNKAMAEFGCRAYASHMEMIEREKPDLVVNAAPSHLHVPISLELLRCGCNVICEKPVAASENEADALIGAAQNAGKVFTVFQDLRYTPHFRQVKKVIDSGVLGRIVHISLYLNTYTRKWDWRTLRSNNGGNLMNIGTHLIDQAIQFLGTECRPNVMCRLDPANTFGDADNYLKLLLLTEGRPAIDIEVSSCCAYPAFRYNVHGTFGGLTGRYNRLKWKFISPEEAPEHALVREPLSNSLGEPSYCREDLVWHEHTWSDGRDPYQVAAREYYKAFHRAFTQGLPFEVTHEQIRQQMAIIGACFRQNPL